MARCQDQTSRHEFVNTCCCKRTIGVELLDVICVINPSYSIQTVLLDLTHYLQLMIREFRSVNPNDRQTVCYRARRSDNAISTLRTLCTANFVVQRRLTRTIPERYFRSKNSFECEGKGGDGDLPVCASALLLGHYYSVRCAD